jgi:hypothetical protein
MFKIMALLGVVVVRYQLTIINFLMALDDFLIYIFLNYF